MHQDLYEKKCHENIRISDYPPVLEIISNVLNDVMLQKSTCP